MSLRTRTNVAEVLFSTNLVLIAFGLFLMFYFAHGWIYIYISTKIKAKANSYLWFITKMIF